MVGNPITQLANTVGARTVVTDGENAELYTLDGNPYTPQQSARHDQLLTDIQGAILAGQHAVRDAPLYDTIVAGIDFDNLSVDDQRLAGYLVNSFIEQEYAGSAMDLSTYWFDHAGSFPGDDVLFPDGYGAITDFLAQGLDVELGQTVTHIDADGSGVTITTQLGTFTGDRAIVTLPLGVLRQGTVSFSPALPAAMQNAIGGLQMGVLDKCYLRFGQAFWPTQFDWLGQLPPSHGQWTTWLNLANALEQPVLLGFNAADFGQTLESWTDGEILDAGMTALRSIFGNGIPNPIDFQITRWGMDPFSLGSYSFVPTLGHPQMHDDLAGNLIDRVFFAGEATHRTHPSTVHGAYLSGRRAALEVRGGALFVDDFESGDTTAWSVASG